MIHDNILSRISSMSSRFSKSEKKIADFILKNPQKVLYTSITDLAEMCGVGDATVFRFCKSLKLNGYQDLKISLAQAIANNDNKEDFVVGEIRPSDDVMSISKKVLRNNITTLNNTFEILDISSIIKATDMISKAKYIHFFGMGSSGVAALHAKHKFMRIRSGVGYVEDCHMQYMTAALMDKEDLAIVFSYSGSTKDIINIVKIAKDNGSKIICITGFAKSPINSLADVCLLCSSKEGPFEGGSFSTILAQLYLFDILYFNYFINHYEQAKRNKKKTTESISSKML